MSLNPTPSPNTNKSNNEEDYVLISLPTTTTQQHHEQVPNNNENVNITTIDINPNYNQHNTILTAPNNTTTIPATTPTTVSTTEKELPLNYVRVKSTFLSLRQWCSLLTPEPFTLNPPITKQQLTQFQTTIQYRLPDEFVAIYARHNGHNPNHPIQFIYNHGEFLSLQRILEVIKTWNNYINDIPIGEDPVTIHPLDKEHGISQVSWSQYWLPFAISGDGNEYFCIDMNPNPALGGIKGQVICVSWYALPRIYICTDIIEFFEILIDKLLHGDIQIEEPTTNSYCTIT